MSIILGALAGAADQYLKEDGEKRKSEMERETHRINSDVTLDRQKTLQIAQEQMRNAPLLRYGAAVKRMQEVEVPVEAAPVTQLTGAGTTYDDKPLQTSGFNGDPDKVRQSIMAGNYPPGVQAQMLAQLDSQLKADTEKAKGIVSGQMRKRTLDEAIEGANQETLGSDPVAYAAYQKEIGAPLRMERREDGREKRDDARTANEAARLATADKRMEDDEAYRRRQMDRQESLMAIQEKRLSGQMDKAETQSQRVAVNDLMKSTERELEDARNKAGDMMLPAAKKEMYAKRAETLTNELAKYRKALETFTGLPADAAPTARGRNGWDSSTGQVFKDGQVIGKADDVNAAKQMVAGTSKPAPKTPAPAAPAQSTPPSAQPKPEATARPAPPVDDPIERAGVEVDSARAALKAISNGPRPGLAAGRQAMDAYAEKLQQAKRDVAAAEAKYQSLFSPQQRAAFQR